MNQIIHGDCVDVMATLPDNYIDLTVTSPPYDNLRDYNGYDFNFEGIANQLYRVTKQGGVVVWVVGDSTIKGSETGTSFRQALYFKEIGFNLHDTMIWHKHVRGACGSNNAYWQEFDYMFVFSKRKPKSINLIKDIKNKSFGQDKGVVSDRNVDGKRKNYRHQVAGVYRRRGNVWAMINTCMNGTKDLIAWEHPATFPEKLANDHIISWSNEGDLILDPLCGSGTTCKMAMVNNRNYIGIDISEEYCEIARKRIAEHEQQLNIV